jgi:hypothetical protein
MHSSVYGKIEKANRYARELDRISIEQISVTFRGDNDTHHVSLESDRWQCNCHYFESFKSCVHVLTMQKILGSMLSEDAHSSFFGASEDTPVLVEAAPA